MSEFNKTKELMEQYKNFDKKSSEIKQEVIRTESLIQHLKEESENIKLEEYESNEESYIKAVKEEYNKRIEEAEAHKTAEEDKLNENDKDKKYFRTDSNLKTITMEIMDIDKEISKKGRALKQINLDIENVFAEPDPGNPLKWQELYNQRDQLNREIKELEGLKEEYTNFLKELESIELTPDEYKEMFAREEAQNAPVENVQDNAEVEQTEEVQQNNEEAEQTEEHDIIDEVNQDIDKEIKDREQVQGENKEVKEKVEQKVEENTTSASQNNAATTAPKATVVTPKQPTAAPKETTATSQQVSTSTTAAVKPVEMEDIKSTIPQIIIGKKVTFRDGKNNSELKLRSLLRDNQITDYTLKKVQDIMGIEADKELVEKLKEADPVLITGIVKYKDEKILKPEEAKDAILGVITKNKTLLKDVLKIKYDKDELSKGAKLPWNKKQRDMMVECANDNKGIAEITGEYKPNWGIMDAVKGMWKFVSTKTRGLIAGIKERKLLPAGKEENNISGKTSRQKGVESAKLSAEQLEYANSRTTENTKSNTQKENENESR